MWSEWFAGQIDDVRVYNRALAQAEIQSDLQTPVGSTGGPPPSDTVAPTPPGSLTATASAGAVDLAWQRVD